MKKQQEEIILTFTEFEILLLLAQNAGIVFCKEQIYDSVWKEPYFGDYNIVMSQSTYRRFGVWVIGLIKKWSNDNNLCQTGIQI